jgi:ATP-dependent helicase/nuclease subunit A
MAEWRPPDQAARDRIAGALASNLLVEAGAGSGKTTAMVQRLVALIVNGVTTIDGVVAVTFTRKAAAELRERFQDQLEQAFRSAAQQSREQARARAALDNLDACFLGTIHAFCGRLLRERPLEAGVPPDFQEIHGAEEELLRGEAWNRFLERMAGRRRADGKSSRLLDGLLAVGLAPRQLFGLYTQIADNGDVRFPAPPHAAPDEHELVTVRNELQRLLTEALRLMPHREPESGWDDLQRRVRSLRFSRDELKWDRRVELLNAALEAVYGNKNVRLNRWTGDRRHFALVRDLEVEWNALNEADNPVRRTCMRWLAHRYTRALRFARAAAAYYTRERLRRGRLTYQDLLLRTAALLRQHPDICRALGERYRFLLIDEFQDTDPLQAEVLFRLAAREPTDASAWLQLEPRAGALFVVGDPKQSIYRFRRADISLYLQVKQRFRTFGEVVELTANFRSGGALARFVNRVFEARFPKSDDPRLQQATYAPLLTHPARHDQGRVAWYRFPQDAGRGWIHIARPDSARIASWIRARIEKGEREPQDFLILTRTKHQLDAFAHALERNDVPYEISGAGVGMEEELRELILLLRALADPGNAVLTLAVLEGLFFGIDHDTLHEHALAGGHFHLLSRQLSGTIVDDALAQLQRMWELVRTETADVAIPLIVDELGILPYAAGGELGATRAGALLYALDVARQGCLVGRTTLAEAIQMLESALERDDAEAPLLPGASNLVRVMNLHRAKGLEAPVVILANPIEAGTRAPGIVQRRLPDGSAEGWFAVFDSTTRDRRKPIARPAVWDALEAEERQAQDAEEDRLMYVAATRAAQELVVARCEKMEEKSVWRCFHALLDDEGMATELSLQPQPLRPRQQLNAEPAWFGRELAALRAARLAQREPAFRAASITERVKPDDFPARRSRRRTFRSTQLSLGLDAPPLATPFGYDRDGKPIFQLGLALAGEPEGMEQVELDATTRAADRDTQLMLTGPDVVPGGAAWGDAVHFILHAAARDTGYDALPASARNALLLAGCPTDALGEPIWLADLLTLVRALRTSQLWQRAGTAQRVLFEVPFELVVSAQDWQSLSGENAAGLPEILSGRIDLAFLEQDGWVIADYKTDVAEPAVLHARIAHYRKQVDIYAACWHRLCGTRVKERQLVFTAPGADNVIW